MYQNTRPKSPAFSGPVYYQHQHQHQYQHQHQLGPIQHGAIHQVAPSASASFSPRSVSSPYISGMAHAAAAAAATAAASASVNANANVPATQSMPRARSLYSFSSYGGGGPHSPNGPARVPSSGSTSGSSSTLNSASNPRTPNMSSQSLHYFQDDMAAPDSPIVTPLSPGLGATGNNNGKNYSYQQHRRSVTSVAENSVEVPPQPLTSKPGRYHRRRSSGTGRQSPAPSLNNADDAPNPTLHNINHHPRTLSITSNTSSISSPSIYKNTTFASSSPVISSNLSPSTASLPLIHDRPPMTTEHSAPQLSIAKHRRMSSSNFAPRSVSNDHVPTIKHISSGRRRSIAMYEESDIDLHFEQQQQLPLAQPLVLPSDIRRMSSSASSPVLRDNKDYDDDDTDLTVPIEALNVRTSNKHKANLLSPVKPLSIVTPSEPPSEPHTKEQSAKTGPPINNIISSEVHSAKSGPPIRKVERLYVMESSSHQPNHPNQATDMSAAMVNDTPRVASTTKIPSSSSTTSTSTTSNSVEAKLSGLGRLKKAFRSSKKADSQLSNSPTKRYVSMPAPVTANKTNSAPFGGSRVPTHDSDSVSLYSIQSTASTASFATLRKVGASLVRGLNRKKSESNLSIRSVPAASSPVSASTRPVAPSKMSAVTYSLASSQHPSDCYTSRATDPVLSHALAEGEMLSDISETKNNSITSTSSEANATSISNQSSSSISSVSSVLVHASNGGAYKSTEQLSKSETLKQITAVSSSSHPHPPAISVEQDDMVDNEKLAHEAQEALTQGDTIFPKSLDLLAADSVKSSLERAKSLERRRSRRSAHKEQVDVVIKEEKNVSTENLTEPMAGAVASKGILKSVSGSIKSVTSACSEVSFTVGNESQSFKTSFGNGSSSSTTTGSEIDLTSLVPIEQGSSLNLDFISDTDLTIYTDESTKAAKNVNSAGTLSLDSNSLKSPSLSSSSLEHSESLPVEVQTFVDAAANAPTPSEALRLRKDGYRSPSPHHNYQPQAAQPPAQRQYSSQHYQRKPAQIQYQSHNDYYSEQNSRFSPTHGRSASHYGQIFTKDHNRVPSSASSVSSARDQSPLTPSSANRAGGGGVSFSSRIVIYDTYGPGDYDRRPDVATCNRLTPILANQIKEELNNFKMEMDIHEESRQNTHFF